MHMKRYMLIFFFIFMLLLYRGKKRGDSYKMEVFVKKGGK